MFLFCFFFVFILELGNHFIKNNNRVTKIKYINRLIVHCFSTFEVGSSGAEGYTLYVDVYDFLKLNFFNFHTFFTRYNYLPVMQNFLTFAIVDKFVLGFLDASPVPIFARIFNAFPGFFIITVDNFLPTSAEHLLEFVKNFPSALARSVLSQALKDFFLIRWTDLPNINFWLVLVQSQSLELNQIVADRQSSNH